MLFHGLQLHLGHNFDRFFENDIKTQNNLKFDYFSHILHHFTKQGQEHMLDLFLHKITHNVIKYDIKHMFSTQ